MSNAIGLSIGTLHFAAVRAGAQPLTRQAVVTLWPDRAAEVGVPSENPELTRPGLVLRGFVDRVGDPAPLIAADGSAHRG
ncbi:MAG: molecular chaperone, partial [Mycobacteriaceae bacterium]|nr:molecular chaperone [Mycobacteriaceae bacterium]